MTPDEFAHLLPAENLDDDAGLLRSAGDIRRLVARVRELGARLEELEGGLALANEQTLEWHSRYKQAVAQHDSAERAVAECAVALAKVEKQRDELAAAARAVIDEIEHVGSSAVGTLDRLKALAELGKEGA